MIEKIYSPAFFAYLLRHRRAMLLFSILLLTVTGLLGNRVRSDFSVEQFFPTWDPARQTYERYKQHFPGEAGQVALFWQENKPLTVQAFQEMARCAHLFQALGLQQVTWLGNAQVVTVPIPFPIPIPVNHPLIMPQNLTDKTLKATLLHYRQDALYQGVLWNKDQTVFVMSGILKPEDNTDLQRKRIEGELTRQLEVFQNSERKLALNGLPIFRSRFLKLMASDQILFVGGGILTTFLLLLVFFRSVAHAFLSLAAVLPAYLMVRVVMVLWDKPLTALTVTLPIILLVIGLSDTTHILFHYRKRRQLEESHQEAIIHAFAEIGHSCFYTALMTAASFLSLIGTGITIVIDFGILTAIGIMLAHFCAMTLYPLLLSFYQPKTMNDRGVNASWLKQTINWTGQLATTHPKPILFSSLLMVIVAASLSSQLRVNAFLAGGLKATHPLMQDIHWVESQGFGMFQINLFIEGLKPDVFERLETHQWMGRLADFLQHEPVVLKTVSLTDKLKKAHQILRGGSPNDYHLPSTSAEIGQLVSLIQNFRANYLRDVYDPASNTAQMIIPIRDQGSLVTIPFLQRLEDYLSQHPPTGMTVKPTGTVQLAQTTFDNILSGFAISLLLDIGALFLLICLMFRSLRHGVIALLPNLFPLFLLLGIMQLCGYQIETSTVLIFSIAFGIAVDATIHLLGLFKSIRTSHPELGLQGWIQESLNLSGQAILITTIVIGGGFSALMLSKFEALFLMGFLIALALLTAVLADLVLLPALLAVFDRED